MKKVILTGLQGILGIILILAGVLLSGLLVGVLVKLFWIGFGLL